MLHYLLRQRPDLREDRYAATAFSTDLSRKSGAKVMAHTTDRFRIALRTLLAVTLFGWVSTAAGQAARELSWDDLLPAEYMRLNAEAAKLHGSMNQLKRSEQEIYDLVRFEIGVRARLEDGSLLEEDLMPSEREALSKKLSEEHPEVRDFWSQVSKLNDLMRAENENVEPTLDGQRVKIPGYVLPLEMSGTKVTEFLLVPFVGACIHVPPPPANQMVFVRAGEGFESAGLFEPVWVEGRLSTQGGTHDLTLVDGEAPVDAGYSLDSFEITPFE